MQSLALEPHQSLTAGVVDDEETYARFLAKFLTYEGFPSAAIFSAEAALREYQAYDVMILDKLLGDVTAFDVAREIHTINPGKWLMLVSGKGINEGELRAQGISFQATAEKGKEQGTIIARLEALRAEMWVFGDVLARLFALLSEVRGSSLQEADRHRLFLEAKDLTRIPVWSWVKNKTKEMRHVALMLRMAGNKLSFVPSDTFGLSRPNGDQLNLLIEAVQLLGMRHISADDEQSLDERLVAIGLDTTLQLPDEAFSI